MPNSASEIQVFHEFAVALDRPILTETISHRDPSEPDIVCEIAREGLVGFELMELIDPRFMARRDLATKTQKALGRFAKEQLSKPEARTFDLKYRNTILYFHFSAAAGYLRRIKLFPSMFEELLALPDGFGGDALRFNKRFLPTLERVRISPSQFNGPAINVSNFQWLGDPTRETISNKLSKTYGCTYPVELLAYIDLDVLPPEGAWKASLTEAVTALEASQIRRLWVFDCNKQHVVAVLP